MDKEQILIKHLKTMLKRTKQSYVTVEQMRETPEYSAVLNAMTELEQELVKNNGVLPVVSGCYWCDNPLVVGQVLEVLPDSRGIAHEKCAEEFYGSKIAED